MKHTMSTPSLVTPEKAASQPEMRENQADIAAVEVPGEGINGRGDDGVEQDDDSDSSVSSSSVLSALSSDSEGTSEVTAETLKQHFAFREQLLSHMSTRKEHSPEYLQRLRDVEEALRLEAMKLINSEEATKEAHQERQEDKQKRSKDTNMCGNKFFQKLAFDVHYTLPGFANILLFCVAHLGMYELCNTVLQETSQSVENEGLVYWSVLGVGLLAYRITGGVYSWLSDDSYEGFKVDLKNRFRVRTGVEASVLRWFRRHSSIRDVTNLWAFYMCFIAVIYFIQCRVMTLLDNRSSILATIPSVQQGTNTSIAQMLATGLPTHYSMVAESESDETCYEFGFCDDANGVNLLEDDDTHLYSQVSVASYYRLMGYADTPVLSSTVTLLFYGISAFASIVALRKLGVEIETAIQ